MQPQISHDFGQQCKVHSPSYLLLYFSEFFILQLWYKPFINLFQSSLFHYKSWVSYFLAIESLMYYTIWISICSAKYVLKDFEVVSFHIVYPFELLELLDRKEWKCSKFLHVMQSCILQTKTESLKPCMVIGMWWPVKLVLQTETKKSHFCVRPWSLLTILNFSGRRSTDTTVF